ncbi:hypothetical protein [Tepidibacillus fermentans]|uniref:Uncharacterized protein n=1 Tax=Tepidibacillus fermentans TaxID=1281767 RepID=A0A4R3KLL0_9BACI|nr:hypothetical protein [Tepidibacillus fermentans]TCS84492.1 hypothetical protein EDD72_101156 [Tepidibacillus fermentans]
MKNWSALLIRHGFQVKEIEENVFHCSSETKENVEFLKKTLSYGNVQFQYHTPLLKIESEVLNEEEWIALLNFEFRGRGEDLYFRPGIDEPKVFELDIYISGIVRELKSAGSLY